MQWEGFVKRLVFEPGVKELALNTAVCELVLIILLLLACVIWCNQQNFYGQKCFFSLPMHHLLDELHTHPFNGPLSRTTRVSWYQQAETNLDFTEARGSEWQWYQLGHMKVCTSL